MVTTTLDNYFWMVDRLQMEDDSRNRVNTSKNAVVLSKHFLKRLENGHYIGRLLHELFPTYVKRSGKQFEMPQSLAEIDPESEPFFKGTWRIIFETLEQFGLNIPRQKRDILLSTMATVSLVDITDALYDIDNSPQGQVSAQIKRKLDIAVNKRAPSVRVTDRLNSVINGSDQDKLSLAEVGNAREFSVRGSSNQKLRPILGSERGSLLPTPSPIKKKLGMSPSLRSLQKSPDRLQSSIILGKESSLVFDSDQIEEALPQTLEKARTSVQFMLTSLVLGFDMKPKQAAALLANNHKYLSQLCIKGVKGSGYSNVIKWYNLIYPHSGTLINLINTEKKDILSYGSQVAIASRADQAKVNRGKILFKTLNILKSGFYSKNSDVQNGCGIVVLQLIKEINHTQSDIMGDAWDWFTTSTLQPEFKRAGSKQDQVQPFRNHRGSKPAALVDEAKGEFEELQFQTGLQAVAFAYETNDSFLGTAVELFLLFGVSNPLELFTQKMQQQLQFWSTYGRISNDILQVSKNTEMAEEILMKSGVVRYWLTNALKIAESQNELPLNDRIVSLIFMTSIWMVKTQFVENSVNGATDAILRILKKAARDVKNTLTIVSIELLFRLLDKFAQERHKIAPTIYKTLTFLLVEFYWETETREYMLKLFIDLFNNVESIPLQILCEPLLKQIEISQYNAASFNVFDFEFFTRLAHHKKLNIQTGLILIESLSKIALTSVFYEKPALNIVGQLMNRFGSYQELHEHWKVSIHEILQTLINIQARFAIHRHHVKNEENNFFNRLALRNRKGKEYQIDPSGGRMSDAEYATVRTNEKLIVNLIQKIVNMENQLINSEIRTQLIDTHIGIQQGLKIDCKATRYLIKLFTPKVDQFIESRLQQNPNAINQVPIPYIQELEHIQADQAHGSLVNPGAVDIYQTKRGNTLRKQISQRSLSPEPSPSRNLIVQPAVAGAKQPTSAADNRKEQATKQYLYEYKKWEEDWEIRQYQQQLKRYNRLYRELHKHYQYESAAKKPLAVDRITFAENEKTNEQISAQSILKMIRDFKLENGVQHNYLKQEVNKLVKFVNIYIMNERGSIDLLTYEGFVNFMLQYAYQLFGHEDNLKAHALIDKLINRMREHPNFQKLGLVISNNEVQTKPKETLEKIGQKVLTDAGIVPHQFKRVDDKQSVVEYVVPASVGRQFVPEATKIAIELLDEIFLRAVGLHILEPVVSERVVTKIVPQIVSVRSPPPRNLIASPIRGLSANQPLTSQKTTQLSAEQEIRQQEYNNFKSQHQRNHDLNRSVSSQASVIQSKLLFKSQAINRRAKQFGDTIQEVIIQADPSDKQIMFEAAEVLNEVLNAVEQGKKALRLDFTPYKLYDLRRRPEQRAVTPVAEEPEPIDRAELQRRREVQQRILQTHENTKVQQELKRQQEQAEHQKEIQRENRIKERARRDYIQRVEELKEERKQPTSEVAKQRKLQQEKEELEERQRLEAQERSKELTKQYKRNLRQEQRNKKNAQAEELESQAEKEENRKEFTERQVQKSIQRAEQLKQKRVENTQVFYQWAQSKPIDDIVNNRFKKGLTILFQKVAAMGKSSGVNNDAWNEFLKQYGVVKFVDAKALHKAFIAQLKELNDVPHQRLATIFKTDVRGLNEKPKDGEINYGGFVSGLIKVVNLRHYLKENERQYRSQNKLDDLSEFKPVDQQGTSLTEFLQFLEVAEKKG